METSIGFGTKIILVVDDEPAITKSLVLVLNHSNQDLFAIGLTELAEALAVVRGIQPDLVLLDVNMPGALRLEHALQMREKCGCRVLLMSGDTSTGDVLDDHWQTGNEPFEILAKPIHPTDLIGQILLTIAQQPKARWKNPLTFHVQ